MEPNYYTAPQAPGGGEGSGEGGKEGAARAARKQIACAADTVHETLCVFIRRSTQCGVTAVTRGITVMTRGAACIDKKAVTPKTRRVYRT